MINGVQWTSLHPTGCNPPIASCICTEYMTLNPDTLPADAPISQPLPLMSVHRYRPYKPPHISPHV